MCIAIQDERFREALLDELGAALVSNMSGPANGRLRAILVHR